MQKLLHERLRENGWEDDTCSSSEIADEIERDYIPRASCSNCVLPDKELSDQQYGEAYDKGYKEGYEVGKTEAIVVPDNAAIAKAGNEGFDFGFESGFDKAAKDPKAWYVLDKNGEPVHIGDRITKIPNWYGADNTEKVIALGENEIRCNGYSAPANTCEKVKPDPWENLRRNIVHAIASRQWGGKTCGEVAQGFIDQARTIATQELAQNCKTTEEFLKATGNE